MDVILVIGANPLHRGPEYADVFVDGGFARNRPALDLTRPSGDIEASRRPTEIGIGRHGTDRGEGGLLAEEEAYSEEDRQRLVVEGGRGAGDDQLLDRGRDRDPGLAGAQLGSAQCRERVRQSV